MNIGLGLAISNKLKIFGSDVSTSVKKVIEYAQKSDVLCDYRVGRLQPWAGERFDVISCDVAAISETIATFRTGMTASAVKQGQTV